MQASFGMGGPGQVRNLIALGCGADSPATGRIVQIVVLLQSGPGGIDLRSPAAILGRLAGNRLARTAANH